MIPRPARSVIDLIGDTPLLRLNKVSDETGCEILGKAEFLNPGGSVKDRAALGIIREANVSDRKIHNPDEGRPRLHHN